MGYIMAFSYVYGFAPICCSPLLSPIPQIINPPDFHDKTLLNALILVYSSVNSQKGCVFVYIKLTLT